MTAEETRSLIRNELRRYREHVEGLLDEAVTEGAKERLDWILVGYKESLLIVTEVVIPLTDD